MQSSPVTSEEGVPLVGEAVQAEPKRVAVKWLWRLFTKNTGLCQLGRGGIGTDACPVLEG